MAELKLGQNVGAEEDCTKVRVCLKRGWGALGEACSLVLHPFFVANYPLPPGLKKQALEIDPTCMKALWRRGQARNARLQFELAITDLQKALDFCPNKRNASIEKEIKLAQQKLHETDPTTLKKTKKNKEEEKAPPDAANTSSKSRRMQIELVDSDEDSSDDEVGAGGGGPPAVPEGTKFVKCAKFSGSIQGYSTHHQLPSLRHPRHPLDEMSHLFHH